MVTNVCNKCNAGKKEGAINGNKAMRKMMLRLARAKREVDEETKEGDCMFYFIVKHGLMDEYLTFAKTCIKGRALEETIKWVIEHE